MRGCAAGSRTSPTRTSVSVFEHAYAEMPPELAEQRDGYAAYLDSFEEAH